MIYMARVLSLIGGTVTFAGLLFLSATIIFEHLLPAEILDQRVPTLLVILCGAVVLLLGQVLGNDLFVLRGKDSIIAVHPSKSQSKGDPSISSGPDFGGWSD